MANTGTPGAMQAKPRLALRLLEQAQTSWRKGVTVGAALLVIAVAYHVVFGQNGLTAYEQKRHDARTLDMQVKSLQQENDLLKNHVDRLQSDPDAIEHQAREELHYTRPGEVIYTLPGSDSAKTAAKN
ncbi:MAG: septum formation initiator family protein [Edaphobacter sp.]|uniref:FtsB family cell division protein n=1 Tax=Edaphobacter sp. TaxID=1934404 RepID=UPI0023A5AA3D|nr:septum formation initiator family protein [Edaphobacter sp.]MDE1176279.1 septum formation initiator family protein [Edaphobacter sp.]